jgi:hypothetical protein
MTSAITLTIVAMFKRLLLTAGLLIPFAAGCQSGNGGSASLKPQAPPTTPEQRKSDHLYQYVDSVRSDLKNGKQRTLNQVMQLSTEESAKFWPIYHDYEEELFDLGDRRVEVIRKFVLAQQSHAMSDDQASVLADEWLKCESDRVDLLRKYYNKVASALSPLRAAQFGQIEHRFNTAIDVMIASEVPLVKATGKGASGAFISQ